MTFNSINKLIIFCIYLILNFSFGQVNAQVNAQITLSKYNVDLGETFKVKLTIQRDNNAFVEFKDTIKSFKPFEFIKVIQYKKDNLNETTVLETTVFEVRSFQVDSVQRMRLPYTLEKNGQTIVDSTNVETLKMVNRIREVSDELQYIPQPFLADVRPPADKRVIYALTFIGILISILTIIVLRKPYLKWKRKNRINKEFKTLNIALDNHIRNSNQDPTLSVMEINRLWNEYLDPEWANKLRVKTFKSLTSKEISEILSQNYQNQPLPFKPQIFAQWRKTEEDLCFENKPFQPLQTQNLLVELKSNLNSERIRRLEAVDMEDKKKK